MSMIYALKQASDATVRSLLERPKLIHSFIEQTGSGAVAQPGLLARWFGMGGSTPPLPVDAGDEVVTEDLDKAWHGLHYLLTDSAWDGDATANFLLEGGTEVGDIDVGYGPARAYTSAEVASVATYLLQLEEATLKERYDPQRMMELDIYPNIWDDEPEEGLDYLMEYLATLKEFLMQTHARQFGMVTYIS